MLCLNTICDTPSVAAPFVVVNHFENNVDFTCDFLSNTFLSNNFLPTD